MAVNWFEGGRRITRLLQALVLGGSAIAVFFGGGGQTRVIFETFNPDQNFRLTMKPCRAGDRSYTLDGINGGPGIELCFRHARRAGDIMFRHANEVPVFIVPVSTRSRPRGEPPPLARRPVPTQRYYWVANRYSGQVDSYVRHRADIFSRSTEGREIARNNAWRASLWAFWERLKDVLPWAFGLVVALAIISATIGWIVRGFAGVPTGKDFREATGS